MASGEPVTILVVDDEPYVRDVVCRWLVAQGYRCVTAGDVTEALALLETEDPSLVLSDITMPGVSGVELLAAVRQRRPNTAVIMVTGVTDRTTAVRCLELGAYGYVIKPFDENEILISVASALERRRLTLISREYAQLLEERIRQRTAEVRRREEEIALRLVSASEYRHEETGTHLRRIGRYTALLAESLGWPSGIVDDLRVAAPMHDVGKIGVPDGILFKPGPLLADEFEEVKKHSAIGADILGGSDIALLNMARDIALGHHENWDGSGYPRGLAGDEIAPAARVVAVADVYDALVSDRVYRPAYSEEEALAIMATERGRRFDPDMYDCFLDIVAEFRAIRDQFADHSGDAA